MRRRAAALLAVWTLPTALFTALAALAVGRGHAPPPPVPEDVRAGVIAPLRAALEDRAAPCAIAATDGARALSATVWLDGVPYARVDGQGASLAAATDDAARALRDLVATRLWSAADRARARIQVDVLGAPTPLAGGGGWLDAVALPGVAALGLVPGADGAGAIGDGAWLLPHELVAAKIVDAEPIAAVPDLAVGVDRGRIADRVRAMTGHGGAAPALVRFATTAFIEPPLSARPAPPLPLTRGAPPGPAVTAATLRAGALRGARYLVDHLGANGRFAYVHDLATGRRTDPSDVAADYSLARHAGAAYVLAEVLRLTHEPWLRAPLERALDALRAPLGGACARGALDCLIEPGETTAQLGPSALAVVAFVEYQRATGDRRYADTARALAAFVLAMQRPDGSFRHVYAPATGAPDEDTQLLYASGEATLALARMGAITGDARYTEAAARGLDALLGWYDFFLGGFAFGEEHWTCIAALALDETPGAARGDVGDRAAAFCRDYAAFLRTQQIADGEELAGGYTATPLLAPYNTPTGSRTEAMISADRLGARHGDADPRVRAQITAALGYLLAQQVRPDSDFAAVGGGAPVEGAMPGSPVERTVRIDFVQHTASAMIRAAEWFDSSPP